MIACQGLPCPHLTISVLSPWQGALIICTPLLTSLKPFPTILAQVRIELAIWQRINPEKRTQGPYLLSHPFSMFTSSSTQAQGLSERGWAEAALPLPLHVPQVQSCSLTAWPEMGSINPKATVSLEQNYFLFWKKKKKSSLENKEQTNPKAPNLTSLRPMSCPFPLQNLCFLLDWPQRSVSSEYERRWLLSK